MADEVPGLLSPSAVGRVGQDLPRREAPPSRHRQPPPRRRIPPKSGLDVDLEPTEPRTVGTRLDVHA